MSTLFAPVPLGSIFWQWDRTCVFGVVNVTPDSFFDGGRFATTEKAIEHAMKLVQAGADVLDIGGESTRPGANPVSIKEELDRVIPVLKGLKQAGCSAALSVDTYKAEVAYKAIQNGASMINDISGFQLDDDMAQIASKTGASVVLGHLRGNPQTMQQAIHFSDVVAEVSDDLRGAVRRAINAGVDAQQIWIDPGIGFGKTAQQSLALIAAAGQLREEVGYPILIGPSRKSFIGEVTGEPVEERLMGTASAVACAIMAGADAVRIHEPAQLKSVIQVADALKPLNN